MRPRILCLSLFFVACAPAATPPAKEPAPPTAPPPSAATTGTKLSAGRDFTCAVASDGRARCWGRNHLGQLGNGTRGDPSSTPTGVADLTDVVSIGAGGAHACALQSSGRVTCWGWNETAADEQHGVRTFPAEIGKGARTLVVGGRHDCIVTTEGAAKCMGWGSDGQLGTGNDRASAEPQPVAGLDHGVATISAGEAHSCAVLEGGKLVCWGSAKTGRLGNGSSQLYASSSLPVDVVNMKSGVATVAAGGERTCALSTAGAVQCWGRWKPGRRLSDADPAEATATPLEVAGLATNVRALAVGQSHACAIVGSGSVKCWGWNERGQLGNGATTDAETPVDVRGLDDAIAISAGYLHTCAVRRTGAIVCWGSNAFGQLGDGTTKDSTVPVSVLEPK